MKYILAFVLLGFLHADLQAQFVKDSSDQLHMIFKTSPDSITLRWAPGSYRVWRAGIGKGYLLERRDYGTGAEFQVIGGGVLKPYSLDEYRQKADIDNDYVALSAEMMHGEIMKTASNAEGFGDFLLAHEEQENRHGFALLAADLHKQAATAQALRYVDKDVEEDKRYEYRLSMPDLPEDWVIDPVVKMAGAAEPRQQLKVLDVVTENAEHGVLVKWDRVYNDVYFNAYYVERAPENSDGFTRLNEKPMLFSRDEEGPTYNFYMDSLEMNNRAYKYRVIGLDPFADESLPSDEAIGMGIDLTGPRPPSAVKAFENADGKMTIEWLNQSIAPDHGGFHIGRSASPTGPFLRITKDPLPLQQIQYVDETAVGYQANYYVVIAVDELGNENKSHMAMGLWRDQTPPGQPEGLTGNVDTLGYVTLIWTPGTELDLLGYRVYVSNAPDVEFFQVTNDIIKVNFFVDSVSLHTLSEQVYYKIVALDRNFNPSEYSEILALKRPDKIRPTSPKFSAYRVVNGGVEMIWRSSSSKDVVKQNIYRSTENEEWALLASLGPADTLYVDSAVVQQKQYQYRLEAVDDAGLKSMESMPLQVFVTGYKEMGPVLDIQAGYNEELSGIEIRWPHNNTVSKYLIYRAEGDGELRYFNQTGEDSFTDTQLYKSAGSFTYAIQAVYKDGNKSALSNPIQFSFDN